MAINGTCIKSLPEGGINNSICYMNVEEIGSLVARREENMGHLLECGVGLYDAKDTNCTALSIYGTSWEGDPSI